MTPPGWCRFEKPPADDGPSGRACRQGLSRALPEGSPMHAVLRQQAADMIEGDRSCPASKSVSRQLVAGRWCRASYTGHTWNCFVSGETVVASEAPANDERRSARAEQRARRASIFKLWSKGGSFAGVGKALGLTRARSHQIVWKAIVDDGLRSERARAWMAKLDAGGYWLKRYDEEFRRPANLYRRKRGGAPARTPNATRDQPR